MSNNPASTAPPTAKEAALKPSSNSKMRGTVSKEMMEKEFVPEAEKAAALATAIYSMTKSHPFLSSVLQCLNISYNHMLPTAGVMFNPDNKRWDMFINPYFFCKKMSEKNRKAILLHELAHITNKHPLRVPFMKISAHRRQVMNIGADMAINQYIKDLPAGCQACPPIVDGVQQGPCTNELCPGRCIDVAHYSDVDKTGKKVPWPENQTMEFYYNKLIERYEDMDEGDGGAEGDAEGGPGGGGMPQTIDEHMWDGSAEEKDMLDATEDLVKRAMMKQKLSYDDLPANIKELLQDIATRRSELDYRSLINSAIKKHASGHERKHTWTRKSRRFGSRAPGTKIGDMPKLSFYIDTSGSISIEEANEFLDIVDNFLKVGSRKCRLNLFSDNNYYSEEYKLGQRLDRGMIKMGGTCLEDSCRDIANKKPDLAVFLTDGCYGDVEVEKWLAASQKFPQCLFIISKGGTTNHPLARLGETIQVPVEMKRK